MDPLLPRLEDEERRRRHRLLFRHNKIPVRMLVPNFFTLLSLCAGLTAIRMAIELRYELAIALGVIAALLDGVDGRLARALKAQSRFGAELDSLADFVNFGVAPAVILFIWGLGGLPRGFGWIVALVFALATGLRLARFNTMLEGEKPKWQSDYFTGMPAPAGALAVLLPLYVDGLGLFDVRSWTWLIALYTAAMAALLGSTIPSLSRPPMGQPLAPPICRKVPALRGRAARDRCGRDDGWRDRRRLAIDRLTTGLAKPVREIIATGQACPRGRGRRRSRRSCRVIQAKTAGRNQG